MALKLENFDHALPFLIFTTMGVIGLMAVGSWVFGMLGWTGPQGLFTRGVSQ